MKAPALNNLEVNYNNYFGAVTSDSFTYDGKKLGTYGMGWYADSGMPGGLALWTSAYSGMRFFTGAAERVRILQSGDLVVNGHDAYARSFISTSSRRYKENIKPIHGALDQVEKLKGVQFDWIGRSDRPHDLGFIAEDAGKIVPEAVIWEINGKDAKGMDYSRVIPLLVEAVKEQNEVIKRQAAQIQKLQDSARRGK